MKLYKHITNLDIYMSIHVNIILEKENNYSTFELILANSFFV